MLMAHLCAHCNVSFAKGQQTCAGALALDDSTNLSTVARALEYKPVFSKGT